MMDTEKEHNWCRCNIEQRRECTLPHHTSAGVNARVALRGNGHGGPACLQDHEDHVGQERSQGQNTTNVRHGMLLKYVC